MKSMLLVAYACIFITSIHGTVIATPSPNDHAEAALTVPAVLNLLCKSPFLGLMDSHERQTGQWIRTVNTSITSDWQLISIDVNIHLRDMQCLFLMHLSLLFVTVYWLAAQSFPPTLGKLCVEYIRMSLITHNCNSIVIAIIHRCSCRHMYYSCR